MKKLFRKFIMLCFCITLFASCSAPTGGNDNLGDIGDVDTTKNVTLNIESAAPLKQNYLSLLRSEEEGTQLYNQALFTKKLVEGFRKKYPNIKLQFIEDGWGDALYQKQQLYIRDYAAGGKMAVDIMIGETYMGYFAKNNVFASLDKAKFTDVVEGSYASMNIDGNIYGVPMCTGIMGLQYNTAILTEAGIAEEDWVPVTWDELLANCKTVNDYAKANSKKYGGIVMNNVSGLSSAFRALPFMRQAGGDFVNEAGQLTLNSEQNKTAFTYLRELAKYAYGDSLTETSEDTLQFYFTNKGYGAYMIEGQWSMSSAPENILSAQLPTMNAETTEKGNCFIGNVLFGITNGSKNKAEAQAFLEYLSSSEVQLWLYELDGRLPVNKTALSSEEIRAIHPNINSYIDALVAGGFGGGLPCFTKNSSDIWEKWGTFYKDVLTSDKDIINALSTLQADITAKLN